MPTARVLLLALATLGALLSCGETSSTTTLSLSSPLSPRTKALAWGAEREQLFADILEHEVGTWDQPKWPKSEGAFAAKEQLTAGRIDYVKRCAGCHGLAGHGDGPQAKDLALPPRDFSLGVVKYKSTPATALPLASDLESFLTRPIAARPADGCSVQVEANADVEEYLEYLLIRHALERSIASALNQLPAFTQSSDSIEQEVQILQVLEIALSSILSQVSGGNQMPHNASHSTSTTPLDGSASRGRELFTSAKAACATCHGHDGAGKGPQTWEPALGGWMLKDMWGNPAIPGDFTRRPWRSGDTATDLARSIRVGIGGTPMPTYQGILSEAEIADLVAYILTLSE